MSTTQVPISDADLAELERLQIPSGPCGRGEDGMLGWDLARTAVPALIAALRECRAERDKWIEDARRDNANRDYWKERAEAAEAEAAALRSIIRRCRESVDYQVTRWSTYEDNQLLADIAKVLEVDHGQ